MTLSRRIARLAGVLLAGIGAVAIPGVALGHNLTGRVESPLPLSVYLAGAAAAVALSFTFIILSDVRAPSVTPGRAVRVPGLIATVLRIVGLVAWLWIVAQAVVGGSSAGDVATIFVSIYGWVGVAIVSAVLAPVWAWLDPFSTLHDIGAAVLRAGRFRRPAVLPYPTWLGAWPAVAGFAFAVWLELAYGGRSTGIAVLGYTAVTLVAMAVFGRDLWRRTAEAFAVWFATLNRLALFGSPDGAPIGQAARQVRRRPIATGVLLPGWTTAHVVLVAIAVASVLYDGLSQSLPWVRVFGIPTGLGATGLLAAFVGLVVLGAVVVGRLVGTAAIGAGLVPIAFGYIVAHYLTYLLGDGQLIVVALSDPLQLGWDLFGTAFYVPSMTWLPSSVVWTLQLVFVVGGHVVGAWAGHVVAVRDAPRGVDVRLRQVPLAALMITLTVVTLWSLGQELFVGG